MAKNLWKSGRVARNDAYQGESNPLPPPDPEFDGVGTVLRKRREERGEDLRYVAQILRIRYPYLKAIEDGHPDELPGPTYAVGFVRTYADHLGLESEKLVQQFKEEAAGLNARADLHFPAPLPEGKIPSGVVLVMAVVLAAVVYGAWIYLSSREQQVAEIVPQLPNRISEIIKGKPAMESPAGTAAASAPPAAAMPPAPANPMGEKPNAMPQAEKPTAGSAAPSVASTASPSNAAPAPAPTPETPAAGQGDVASSASEAPSSATIPQPPGTGSDTSESDVTPPPSVVASAPGASDSGSQGATGAEGPSDADRTPPKVYGEANSNPRVVIHAAADSWVEVRDSTTDELLLTRVLFKGDKYNVPDRGGLTLLTGNAGGLRIVVDGTDAPAIGPLGAVRRNVSLEPSALLAGNAFRPSSGGVGPTDSQTSDSGVQSQ